MSTSLRKASCFDKFNSWVIITAAALILILVFIIYPFSVLVIHSVLTNTGEISFANYLVFFRSGYYMQTLFNSFLVSFSASILALLIGVPVAYFLARYRIRGKSVIDHLFILAMLSPPFIGAYSWIVLLGRAGFITTFVQEHFAVSMPSIYGFTGILLVFTLKLFPFVYLYVSGALRSMDASLEEAAESLGVSGWKKLRTITFPLVLPTILSAALMVFMTALADFGTPALIGEGFRVLPVSIYDEYMSELGGNTGLANVLSVVMITFAMLVLLLQKKAVSDRSYAMSNLRPPVVKTLSKSREVLVTIGLYLIAFLGILPQFTVIITSFINTSGPVFLPGFGLNSYREAFSKASLAISNSFLFSIIAITVMVVCAMLIAYLIVRRNSRIVNLIDMLVMFPYVIPGAVLGVMLVNAFNTKPLLLTGTMGILIISYVIRKMPFTLRSSIGILYQIEQSVEEASISLGVPPLKTFFKITGRLMLPGVISGAILSWIATMNELSSTMILYTGATQTISVAIFHEVTSKAHFGTAAALATILTVATIISLWLCKRLSGGKISF
ncbi:iron ABC transporter permease [Selenomonas sp. TAMA-11512]|uniref:ABC transporter permease n=1 Tax=Selenomonas sp. TAMA-11512 TaxID=3095337 RepID=UPI0030865D19|nr:iron ABC transporter permease [Selenomonas sp. TAMA-11512]